MIIDYRRDILSELEDFFKIVLNARGWGFYLEGRHSALRDIENVYPKEKGGFWVCLLEYKVIGTVAIRELDKNLEICELKSMYVLPEYQGRGHGRNLMNYAIGQAKEKGYKYIRLDTTKDSEKAINLYRTTGFYEIDRYNDNSFTEVFMELHIPNMD
jgi:putative acetyltransferase